MKAYASRKLGLAPSEASSPNRLFVPLKTELKAGKKERAGCECTQPYLGISRMRMLMLPVLFTVDLLTNKAQPMIRPDSQAPSTNQLVAPLVSLNTMLSEVSSMLENVLEYVKKVTSGSEKGDVKIGRYLLETLASVPLPTTQKGAFEEDFNTHLAVRDMCLDAPPACAPMLTRFDFVLFRIFSWSHTSLMSSVSTWKSQLARLCFTMHVSLLA